MKDTLLAWLICGKIALVAGLLALSGCNGSPAVVNNTLASLAKNDIPAACAIIKVAEGYYSAVVTTPNPAVVTAENTVAVICNNPPTDLAAAFSTLLDAWTVIQAGTAKTP